MRGPWPKGVGFYGLLGAVLVLAGSVLPWLTLGGKSVSAWQIPVLALIGRLGVSGPPAGIFLMVVLLVLLPYAIRRPLPTVVRLAIALVATNLAVGMMVQEFRGNPAVFPGIGVILTMAGGILLIVGDVGSRALAARRS